MKKLVSVLALFAMLVIVPGEVANASTAKIGGACKVVGAKKTIAGKPAICAKRGSKKVWKLRKIAAPALGTVSNPAAMGVPVKVSGFTVTLVGITDNVDGYICSSNFFNSGCTWNDNFDGIPDPSSTKRWVRISFSASNTGTEAKEFSPIEIGLVGNGVANLQTSFQPVADDLISNLKILPGGSAVGSLYVWLDKSTTYSGVVFQQDFYPATLTFFKAN